MFGRFSRHAPSPPSPALAPLSSAQEFCDRGDLNLKRCEYDLAIADYTEALRLNPDMLAAFIGRGVVSYELRSWDKAIADFTLALRRNAQFTVALVNRGNAYIGRGDLEKALADFGRAIEIDDKSWRAYLGRALVLEKLGRHRESEIDQSRAAAFAAQEGVEL